MTRTAHVGRAWVVARLPLGNRAVVAVAARANYLVMIHFGGRLPSRLRVAGLAVNRRLNVSGRFAFGNCAVMTGRARTDDLCMVNFSRGFPCNRIVAALAGIRRIDMRCILAARSQSVVAA